MNASMPLYMPPWVFFPITHFLPKPMIRIVGGSFQAINANTWLVMRWYWTRWRHRMMPWALVVKSIRVWSPHPPYSPFWWGGDWWWAVGDEWVRSCFMAAMGAVVVVHQMVEYGVESFFLLWRIKWDVYGDGFVALTRWWRWNQFVVCQGWWPKKHSWIRGKLL